MRPHDLASVELGQYLNEMIARSFSDNPEDRAWRQGYLAGFAALAEAIRKDPDATLDLLAVQREEPE